jgi:two-component system nitrate/nitrite response regulator NarL
MPIRVLIVEDNPVARNFLVRVVHESFSDEISVAEAGDLESARRALGPSRADRGAGAAASGFRLVLTDLELPDGNGLELLAELTGYPATKIVTTLYSDDDHLFPALQCGADGYLLKEDRFEVLVEELQKIVRGQPPLSPAIARRLLSHFRGSDVTTQSGPGTLDYNTSNTAFNTGGFNTSGFGGTRPIPMELAPAATATATAETERLTPRENEVLTYLSKGFTIKEIANLMGIKWFTVNDHIKSIYKKLNVSSRAEAAVLASKQGLV